MRDSTTTLLVMLSVMIAAFIAALFTSWWVMVIVAIGQLLPFIVLTVFNFITDRKRNPLVKALEQLYKAVAFIGKYFPFYS